MKKILLIGLIILVVALAFAVPVSEPAGRQVVAAIAWEAEDIR